MKFFLSVVGSVALMVCAPLAKAILVEDVVEFNQFLQAGDSLTWEHDFTKYGYELQTPYSHFSLILEVRDAADEPDKDVLDRPFFIISQSQGRSFGRVLMEDLVIDNGVIFVDNDGLVLPRFGILEGEVWIGRAIARLEFEGGTSVPEPKTIMLFALGLGLLVVRRHLFTRP